MRAVLLTSSIRSPLTGIGRYTLELAKQFDALQAGVHFVGGVNPLIWSEDRYSDQREPTTFVSKIKRVVKSSSVLSSIFPHLRASKEWYLLRGYRDCVVHSPNFYLPASKSCKRIVTIHDLSMFLFPDCFEPGTRSMMQSVCKKTILNADAIITISHSVKKELCDLFSYPKDRVFVTHLAGDPKFHPRCQAECLSVLNKYNLAYKSYTLFVGTIEPRKNLLTLIQAYRSIPDSIRKKYPLVVIGYKGWKSEREHSLFGSASEAGWLKYLSYVTEQELPVLYSGSKLLFLPSLYEGFGLPLVEAMSSGIPVVCSNIPVLREIGAVAPCYVNSTDVNQWTSSITECLINDKINLEMSNKGLHRSQEFSWLECAKQTLQAYDKTLKIST